MAQLTEDTPLAQAIDRAGLRRDFVARRCGVKPWTVSRWLRGASRPDPSQQLALGALLNLDIEDVLELVDAGDPIGGLQ